MAKTQSERLFEEYLGAQGLTDFEFEIALPRVAQKPDYCLTHRGKKILLEVKEFRAPKTVVANRDDSVVSSVVSFDPYPRIREKINQGGKKFRNLKDYPCGLVLHNLGAPHVLLDDPRFVWGAMLGNIGFSVPVDPAGGRARDDLAKPVFTTRGKMVQYAKGRPSKAQNTTISAILVLSHLAVGSRRFHARYSPEIQAASNRERQMQICLELMERTCGTDRDVSRKKLRVVVHENPYARIRLPRELFRGPYDEWYEVGSDRTFQRSYAGKSLIQLEDEETASGVQDR